MKNWILQQVVKDIDESETDADDFKYPWDPEFIEFQANMTKLSENGMSKSQHNEKLEIELSEIELGIPASEGLFDNEFAEDSLEAKPTAIMDDNSFMTENFDSVNTEFPTTRTLIDTTTTEQQTMFPIFTTRLSLVFKLTCLIFNMINKEILLKL